LQENKISIKSNSSNKKDRIKFDFGKQGGYIFAILIIYFVFFGLICSYYGRNINEELIWLYTTIFEVYFGTPALLLFFISLILTYKEDIYHYGIKNSIWLNFFIILFSFFWYWTLKGFSFVPFMLLFGTYQGYLTILILIVISIGGALSGWKLKEYVLKRKKIEK
jgi:hypothetical protein